ncbi:NAD(P)-dependent oxidoreductase [Spirillospora sp. CA-294931]|uniref:NAD(P)-dependent oxidoreductase n=1 Tax=Spirillospora sp. CA-294931 TaxID=3240042 RepID=UPI003D92C51B
MDNRTPVTVIGLGPMGQALAGAFLKAGHPTTVWNRTASKADALVKEGAALAASPAEAIEASPLIVVCVLHYDAALGILAPATESLKGRTLVNLTADSPRRARETAAWADEHGIGYLDGSIMTPTMTIGTPDAVVLFSGPEERFRAHEQTLAALGGPRHYLGEDPGRAAAYDIALLDAFWTTVGGVTHALALAEAEGIKPSDLVPLAQGIISLVPTSLPLIAGEVENNEFPGDYSNVASGAAGMDHIIEATEAQGMDASIMRAIRAAAQRALDAGHAADGFGRLVEAQRPH